MTSAAAMLNQVRRHRHVPDPAFQPKLLVSNASGFVGVIITRGSCRSMPPASTLYRVVPHISVSLSFVPEASFSLPSAPLVTSLCPPLARCLIAICTTTV